MCLSSGSEAPAGGGLLRVPWSCLGAPVEFRTERKAPETFLCTEVPRPVRRVLPWERGSKSRPQPGPSRRTCRATGFHQGQRRSHVGKQTEQTAVTPGQVESPRHGDGAGLPKCWPRQEPLRSTPVGQLHRWGARRVSPGPAQRPGNPPPLVGITPGAGPYVPCSEKNGARNTR